MARKSAAFVRKWGLALMQEQALTYLLDNARGGGAHTERVAIGHWVIHPTLDWPIFNWALLRPGLPPARLFEGVAVLAEALMAEGRRPSFVVPADSHPQLGEGLQMLGLSPREEHQVFLSPLSRVNMPQAPGGVTASEPADPGAWLELLCDGFEVPVGSREPFRQACAHLVAGDSRASLYTAHVNGQPAGAAYLWYENGIAGLNTATVSPAFRGRGVYTALLAARLERARALGAAAVAAETAEPIVQRALQNLGFEPALSFRFWY